MSTDPTITTYDFPRGAEPAVSVVMPTFNRAKFLPEAFASIAEQLFSDFELVVVDDGSTDETSSLLPGLINELGVTTRVIAQSNAGVGRARNIGVDHARAQLVAFFDSDDLWLPHHLADCVAGLGREPDVSWVFGAGRRVDLDTGDVVVEHSFHDPQDKPFLKLEVRESEGLRVITDERAPLSAVSAGEFGGLQGSVFRLETLLKYRFPEHRVGEDYAFWVRALSGGCRVGYFDKVHVVYRIHGAQVSASGKRELGALIESQERYCAATESLLGDTTLPSGVQERLLSNAFQQRFWALGYNTLWQNGRPREALACFRQALSNAPDAKKARAVYRRFWWRHKLGLYPRTRQNIQVQPSRAGAMRGTQKAKGAA